MANVAGTIVPGPIPPSRSISDLISRPNPLSHLDGVRLAARGTLGETLNSVSSVAPFIQQTSIKNLEPLFKSFTDAEVSVYAMDDQPIGPRIRVPDVPEPTLKAIASFEVQRRGRHSDRRWHIVAAGIAAVVAGVVTWILRGLLGV